MKILNSYLITQITGCLKTLNKKEKDHFHTAFTSYLYGIQECYHDIGLNFSYVIGFNKNSGKNERIVIAYLCKDLNKSDTKRKVATIYCDRIEYEEEENESSC